MEQLGSPLGVSCTQDGLTITADAILADDYAYAILYSIQREDVKSESVSFQEYTMQWPQRAQRTSSTLRPHDEDTSDQMQARKDLVFSEITPLDTIESLTIGDLTVEIPTQ